jgi:cell division septal protein FtsQ
LTLPRRPVLVLCALALIGVLWVGWGWFRDSSLVQVRHVEISGVSNSPDADAIKRELKQAALGMTTLHVDEGKLDHAVSAYPIVRGVSASGNFPSKIQIKVHEYAPVAALTAPDGRAVPVAFDGTLLPRLTREKLPTVAVTTMPTHNGFESSRVASLVRVLAGAPEPLRPQLDRAYMAPGGQGILIAMRAGPTLELGTPSRLAAKWASATRVLAAPSSTGAGEIDVRLPERPAARGFASAQNPRL